MTRSRGFTIIEIMVVLVIMSVFLSIVILGFERIESRRVEQQADELVIWLKYVADSAIFDGVVYGIDLTPATLQVYGLSRGQWSQALAMETFLVAAPTTIDFQTEPETSAIGVVIENDKEDAPVVPELVLMPGGTIEPNGSFIVTAEQQSPIRVYWNDDGVLESRTAND
jgi:general secretion pathway protein H